MNPKVIFSACVALSAITSCSTQTKEIKEWTAPPPRDSKQLTDVQAMRAEYADYEVKFFSMDKAQPTNVILTKDYDAGTEIHYKYSSFGPIFADVSPRAMKKLETIQSTNKYIWFSAAAILVGVLAPISNSARQGLIATGIGGALGIYGWQFASYPSIWSLYNEDLHSRVFGNQP